jgi:uncharacterized protein HemY
MGRINNEEFKRMCREEAEAGETVFIVIGSERVTDPKKMSDSELLDEGNRCQTFEGLRACWQELLQRLKDRRVGAGCVAQRPNERRRRDSAAGEA